MKCRRIFWLSVILTILTAVLVFLVEEQTLAVQGRFSDSSRHGFVEFCYNGKIWKANFDLFYEYLSLDPAAWICIRRQKHRLALAPKNNATNANATQPNYSSGAKMFKITALVRLSEGLNKLQTWNISIGSYYSDSRNADDAVDCSSHVYPQEVHKKRFHHRKPKQSHSRCLYYANSCAARQILLRGGDISVNPGPPRHTPALSCS